jgi:hypothetical protein
VARDAQAWTRHLAELGLCARAPPEQRFGQGENIWRGRKGYWSQWNTIGFFIAEKRHFLPGIFPDVLRTGTWSDVGHCTQMIWPQTLKVGCGLAETPNEQVLACRYWLAGNIWGKRIAPLARSRGADTARLSQTARQPVWRRHRRDG